MGCASSSTSCRGLKKKQSTSGRATSSSTSKVVEGANKDKDDTYIEIDAVDQLLKSPVHHNTNNLNVGHKFSTAAPISGYSGSSDMLDNAAMEIPDSSYSMMSVSIEPEDDSVIEDQPVWFDKVPDSYETAGIGANADLEDLMLKNVDMNGAEIRIHTARGKNKNKGIMKSESTKKKVIADRYDMVINTTTADDELLFE